MQCFIVEIYDIKDIEHPKLLKEISLEADGRTYAIDKAHTEAERLYPEVKRMVHVRQNSQSFV